MFKMQSDHFAFKYEIILFKSYFSLCKLFKNTFCNRKSLITKKFLRITLNLWKGWAQKECLGLSIIYLNIA